MNSFKISQFDTKKPEIRFSVQKRSSSPSGFVILFTVLISVIILLLGLGIFAISTKELQLASLARESHIAFTAADTGTECALLGESKNFITPALSGPGTTFPCINGEQFVLTYGQGGSQTSGFVSGNLLLPAQSDEGIPTCAQVIIFNDQTTGMRVVRSRGFNICNNQGEPELNDPRLVERVLEFTFFAGGGAVTPEGGSSDTSGDDTVIDDNDSSGDGIIQ